jgi:TonB family protein
VKRYIWGACALIVTTPLLAQPSVVTIRLLDQWRSSRQDGLGKDFPQAAKAKGVHGVVRFVLAIDAGGEVYRCDIVRSSNVPGLDQQTCALMRSRGKFKPATDQSGAFVPSEWSRKVSV